MAEDKGVQLACQVARESNVPIVLAGRDNPQYCMHEHPGGLLGLIILLSKKEGNY